MRDERGQAVTWHHVFWHARAGLIVFAIAALALIVPSQMKDLLADLAGFDGGDWALAIAFHVALILMAFFLWYWTRTVLLAVFRIPDTRGARDALAVKAADGGVTVRVFDWLPRLLFLGCAVIAAIAAARSEKYLQAGIAVLWGIALCWALTHRLDWRGEPQDKARVVPERPRADGWLRRLWRRLLDLIDCGPFSRWLAALLLILASGLFALSAALAFVPGAIAYMTFPARWFPGASAALLLFGFSVGPLTALTYVFNRIDARLTLFGAELQWRHFPVLLVLLALIVLGPLKMNLHALRIVTDPSAMKPAARVSMADYFRHWVQTCAPGNGPVRPVLVSVSGGASRAGLWAARVLTLVDTDLAGAQETSVFSVSSVSGGSLGTAAYMAMRASAADGGGKPACRLADLSAQAQQALVEALRADAIGPALAGTFLGDAPRAIMGVIAAPVTYLHNKYASPPWVFRGNDRAEALERAFEENWQSHGIDAMPDTPKPLPLDAPYLSLFYKNGTLRDYVPAWIANGTDQQKGDRIITAPFKINAERFCTTDGRWYADSANCAKANATYFWYRFGPFLSALDALSLLKADIPASTAVDNTSRFPFLSPSGELTPAQDTLAEYSAQIIDGGYFENEGLATSLEIARWLETYGPALIGRPVFPVLVQATSDADIAMPASGRAPSTDEQNAERHIPRCGNARPENPGVGRGTPRSAQLLVPVLGLSAVRGGHTHVALKEAQQEFCNLAGHQAFFNFYLYNGPDFDVPLNWVLSERVGKFIWSRDSGALGACWNRAEEANLKESFASSPQDWTPGRRRAFVYACRSGQVARVAIPDLPPPMTGP